MHGVTPPPSLTIRLKGTLVKTSVPALLALLVASAVEFVAGVVVAAAIVWWFCWDLGLYCPAVALGLAILYC